MFSTRIVSLFYPIQVFSMRTTQVLINFAHVLSDLDHRMTCCVVTVFILMKQTTQCISCFHSSDLCFCFMSKYFLPPYLLFLGALGGLCFVIVFFDDISMSICFTLMNITINYLKVPYSPSEETKDSVRMSEKQPTTTRKTNALKVGPLIDIF